MSRKSQEEVTTEYWSKLSSQSSPSMKKDTNKEGPHNKEENEVEDLVEEWLLHQNTEIRSRWRIHCRCFPGISQATRNQTSLKGRIEQSLTWPEALTSNHTIPPTGSKSKFSQPSGPRNPYIKFVKIQKISNHKTIATLIKSTLLKQYDSSHTYTLGHQLYYSKNEQHFLLQVQS
ncbi:hypothetical protein ACOSQ3_006474 [Xanthoceras sorbifolium]